VLDQNRHHGIPGSQRADAPRNRERLLAAAVTAFNARGAGASLDDIAKAAGVGNATLYRHFPTRAKLLEAVYDQRIAVLCAAAAELAQPAAPARALHEWLRAVVTHVTDRRVLTGVGRAGSPAQAERFLSVLLEGITPRLPLAGTPGIFRHGWGGNGRPESQPGPFEITGMDRPNGRPPPRSTPASRKSLALFV
jgi:AcrR family transcriptional regulator